MEMEGLDSSADGHIISELVITQSPVDSAIGSMELAECYQDAAKGEEKTADYTSLLEACTVGDLPLVKLLLEGGVDTGVIDSSGWSARELAALHGHLEIAELLPEAVVPNYPPMFKRHLQCLSENQKPGASRRSSIASFTSVSGLTDGHLTDESSVLVYLGSVNRLKASQAVDLDEALQPNAAASIVISARGATGARQIIDLPITSTSNMRPVVFRTKDLTNVKLIFDIMASPDSATQKVAARAVALLSSIRPNSGAKRTSLEGDASIPLVAAETLDVIGSINFSFLIVNPFTHPKMDVSERINAFEHRAAPMLIGHRGLGKNTMSQTALQLGENTVQSFITAARLGAEYVEFDVQITKDLVPVLYHDFLVSETGIDALMHTLTLEQFMNLNKSPISNATHSAIGASQIAASYSTVTPPRSRGNSLGAGDLNHSDMTDRMRHTRQFKEKGFKSNSRQTHIQTPFATLEIMFRRLPEHVGFNIEVKYPMLDEAAEQEMDPYAIELNTFVDAVLNTVYSLCGKRNIVFSSFHPDVCILLKLKQPRFSVLFLTDAGTRIASDMRATSLHQATEFATQWNLLGVVSNAKPFMMCPRLIRAVKDAGLVCVSYGTPNNEPESVRVQVREGIDAVIVDSVLKIRRALDADGFRYEDPAVCAERHKGENNGTVVGI